MTGLRARLRDARYALPGWLGPKLTAPAPLEIANRLRRHGYAATFGYFQAEGEAPERIVAAYRELGEVECLSIKAPPLAFDPAHLQALAELGPRLMFDAHAPKDAEATLDAGEALSAGVVLPARWRRSSADAVRFRETATRIRIVKGEWPDPAEDGDAEAGYLDLVRSLAGRAAPVAVATHDPILARNALATLVEAGTPCELEQLRGLPRRRTVAVARSLGVPVRIYVPFGPGWWPYAIDKALARPYLPLWAIRDRLGLRD